MQQVDTTSKSKYEDQMKEKDHEINQLKAKISDLRNQELGLQTKNKEAKAKITALTQELSKRDQLNSKIANKKEHLKSYQDDENPEEEEKKFEQRNQKTSRKMYHQHFKNIRNHFGNLQNFHRSRFGCFQSWTTCQ